MIYPQKLNAKKADLIVKIGVPITAIIIGILILINSLCTPDLHWAAIAAGGIIYTWITAYYAVKKNHNIADHVLIQLILLSILTAFIDHKLGFKGWSMSISIPILIIVANTTMFVLAIVSRKKYIKYAICQLLIVIFSMMPMVFIFRNMIANKVLSIVALGISAINFALSLALSFGDIKEEVKRWLSI